MSLTFRVNADFSEELGPVVFLSLLALVLPSLFLLDFGMESGEKELLYDSIFW